MRATAILVTYATLVAAMVGLDVWARYRGHRSATIGGVLGALMATAVGRWLVLLAWVWMGWHLFVRSTA